MLSGSFEDVCRGAKRPCSLLLEVKPGDTLLSRFSSHTVNKCPSRDLFSVMFFSFLMMILLFKMAPNHSAEALSRVPKRKKAVMCLKEKIRVLDELCTVMNKVTGLLAMSSTLVTQPTVCIK